MPSIGRQQLPMLSDPDTPCLECEHNDKGWCLKDKRFGHIARCEKKRNLPTVKAKPVKQYKQVKGVTCIRMNKDTGSYQVKFTEYSRDHILGSYPTLQEAVTALAREEIKVLGKRKRNLHIGVKLYETK
jgi:hypothetical protein